MVKINVKKTSKNRELECGSIFSLKKLESEPGTNSDGTEHFSNPAGYSLNLKTYFSTVSLVGGSWETAAGKQPKK